MIVSGEFGIDEWIVPFVQGVLLHSKMERITYVDIFYDSENYIHFNARFPYLWDEDENETQDHKEEDEEDFYSHEMWMPGISTCEIHKIEEIESTENQHSENIWHESRLNANTENEGNNKSICYEIPDTEYWDVYDDEEGGGDKQYWIRFWIDKKEWGTYFISYILSTYDENQNGVRVDSGSFKITHSDDTATLLWHD